MALHENTKHGKILDVRNGFLVCPKCRQNRHVMQIPSYTIATRVVAFCRMCKWEHDVDIDQGQCFESRSQ